MYAKVMKIYEDSTTHAVLFLFVFLWTIIEAIHIKLKNLGFQKPRQLKKPGFFHP